MNASAAGRLRRACVAATTRTATIAMRRTHTRGLPVTAITAPTVRKTAKTTLGFNDVLVG